MPISEASEPRSFRPASSRRLAELERVRAAINSAMDGGRAACARDHSLTMEIAPLLDRLAEIREEIDHYERSRLTPRGGDLYPFWMELARNLGS